MKILAKVHFTATGQTGGLRTSSRVSLDSAWWVRKIDTIMTSLWPLGQKLTKIKWPNFLVNFRKWKKLDNHFVGLDLSALKLFSDLSYLLWLHSKRGFGQWYRGCVSVRITPSARKGRCKWCLIYLFIDVFELCDYIRPLAFLFIISIHKCWLMYTNGIHFVNSYLFSLRVYKKL